MAGMLFRPSHLGRDSQGPTPRETLNNKGDPIATRLNARTAVQSQLAIAQRMSARQASATASGHSSGLLQRRPIDVPGLGLIETRNYDEASLNQVIGLYLSGLTPPDQPVSNYDLMQEIFEAIEAGEFEGAAQTSNDAFVETRPELNENAALKQEEKKDDSNQILRHDMHHFSKGTVRPVYSKGKRLVEDDGKPLSSSGRRDTFKRLGIGEHLASGHVGMAQETLISQARSNVPNFTWSNEMTMLGVIESAGAIIRDRLRSSRTLASNEQKTVEVSIQPDAGFGVVIGTDGACYRVIPKQARVVAKAKGDFKTAYGVTEVKDPARFSSAYHDWVRLG
jgi:hypothetical protein